MRCRKCRIVINDVSRARQFLLEQIHTRLSSSTFRCADVISIPFCSEECLSLGDGAVVIYLDMTSAHRFYLLEGRLADRVMRDGTLVADIDSNELESYAISPRGVLQRLGLDISLRR
jgi:hypothetical protein